MDGAFPDVQSVNSTRTDGSQMQAFELSVGKKLDGLPYIFLKQFQTSNRVTIEQLSTLPQSILNCSVSGSCSRLAPSLHDRSLTCICR